jgi:hypothetical protein
VSADEITEAQRRIGPRPLVCRTRTDFRRCARWWELEARRGYESTARSLQYAANMRWAAELTETYGPGTWLELNGRVAGSNHAKRPA